MQLLLPPLRNHVEVEDVGIGRTGRICPTLLLVFLLNRTKFKLLEVFYESGDRNYSWLLEEGLPTPPGTLERDGGGTCAHTSWQAYWLGQGK